MSPFSHPFQFYQLKRFAPDSPNHTEAFRLLSIEQPTTETVRTLKPLIEKATLTLSRSRPRIATIVRAGWLGCCYVETAQDGEEEEAVWVGPYWDVVVESQGMVEAEEAKRLAEGATQPSTAAEAALTTSSETPTADSEARKDVSSGSSDCRSTPTARYSAPSSNSKGKDLPEAESPLYKVIPATKCEKVVDPTGAGNAFMGGLAAAIRVGCNIEEGELAILRQPTANVHVPELTE